VKGRAISYSAAEMAWLEDNRAMVISDYHLAFVAAFGRDDVSLVNLHSLRKRKGWKTGRSGRFEAGQRSWNKGLHYTAPGSEKGWFRKGERRGVAVKLYKPVGTERLSKEGYREIKIHDGMPLQSRWRALHLVEWEKINGPIPTGMCLKCLDGDRSNVDPSNWEDISRGVLARLNGGPHKRRLAFDQAEPEVKPLVMAMAKLQHRAHQRKTA
jgi:hypothetical protein